MQIADQELDHFAKLNQELFAPHKSEAQANVHKLVSHKKALAEHASPAHAAHAHAAKVAEQKVEAHSELKRDGTKLAASRCSLVR